MDKIKMIQVSKTAHFSGHKDSVYALASNWKEKVFYSGGADGMVAQWNVDTKSDGLLMLTCPTPIYSLCLFNKHIIIAGTREGNLHIGDIENKKELKWIKAHDAGIFDIQPYLDGFITASGDGSLAIWDKHFALQYKIQISAKRLSVVRFLSEHTAIVGCSDHTLYQVNVSTKKVEKIYTAHTQSVFALDTQTKHPFFYSGGRDAQLIKWDTKGDRNRTLPAHLYHINYLHIHPTLPFMLSCSMDKTIKLWDINEFKLLKVIDYERHQSHVNCINKVLWIDTNHFISCADDRTVMVFEIFFE